VVAHRTAAQRRAACVLNEWTKDLLTILEGVFFSGVANRVFQAIDCFACLLFSLGFVPLQRNRDLLLLIVADCLFVSIFLFLDPSSFSLVSVHRCS